MTNDQDKLPGGETAGRVCMQCGAEIVCCMGFVVADDFIRAFDEEIPWSDVRERCGRCAFGVCGEAKNSRRQHDHR